MNSPTCGSAGSANTNSAISGTANVCFAGGKKLVIPISAQRTSEEKSDTSGSIIKSLPVNAKRAPSKRLPNKGKRKRKTKQTPLTWSMELMRQEGFRIGKTEHFNKFVGFRQDLFGFIDALAMDERETVAIQSCVIGGDIQKHLIKMAGIPEAFIWLSLPGRRLELHAWGLQGPRGEQKRRVIRRINITTKGLSYYGNTTGRSRKTNAAEGGGKNIVSNPAGAPERAEKDNAGRNR